MADGKVTIDTELDDSGAKKGIQGLDGLKSVAGGVTKAIAGISAVAVAGAGAIVKSSTDAYASYEQLTGGIETLFKDSAEDMKRFAQNGYETAGMSANEYMETVTSFSASLIQSLGGDTEKAVHYSNMAITDMSDNANKMGVDIENIQNAYRGFSKGNFTMLDNLSLGYGGTRGEMERLLADAEKLSGIKYNIDSFADISDAIHVMQVNMDISGYSAGELQNRLSKMALTDEELTKVAKDMGISFDDAMSRMKNGTLTVKDAQALLGTTAREASTTIEGSANMMRASWENLLVGIADDNANFDELIQNFVDSVGTYAENILPRVEIALNGMVDLISKLAPVIAEKLPQMINQTLPKLITAGLNIVKALVDAIIKSLPALLQSAIELVKQLGTYIIDCLPMLIQAGFEIIFQLVDALADALPNLIPATIDMLLTILETLIDNVDMLIDASIKIMLALTDGILNALPILIDKVPTIIEKLLKALIDNAPKILKAGLEINKKLLDGIIKIFPQLKEKGKEIVDKIHDAISSKIASIKEVGGHIVTGLWQGISDKFGWLTGQLQSFAHNVTDKLKSFFGIHSPSRVMRDEVGQWLAKGVSLGFTENNPMNEINATMQKGMNKLSDLSLNYSANMGYNGIIDYDKMADAFSKSGMPITFKGREFGRIVRSYV